MGNTVSPEERRYKAASPHTHCSVAQLRLWFTRHLLSGRAEILQIFHPCKVSSSCPVGGGLPLMLHSHQTASFCLLLPSPFHHYHFACLLPEANLLFKTNPMFPDSCYKCLRGVMDSGRPLAEQPMRQKMRRVILTSSPPPARPTVRLLRAERRIFLPK